MPKTEFTIDSAEIMEAMKFYQEATGKDGADVVNNAAKTAVLGGGAGKVKGAIQLTKKATASDLTPFNPAKKRAREYSNNLFHALAAEGNTRFGKAVKGQGNRDKALKIYNSRKQAIGFAKAIWIGIGKQLGAKLRSKFTIPGTKAKMATPVTLTATFETGTAGGEELNDILSDALQQGLDNAGRDMRQYAEKKMAQRAEQFSGR